VCVIECNAGLAIVAGGTAFTAYSFWDWPTSTLTNLWQVGCVTDFWCVQMTDDRRSVMNVGVYVIVCILGPEL